MITKELKEQILAKLTERLNLQRVILFGSRARGIPGTESDIDLLVVTDNDLMPETYEQAMAIYLEVSSALRDIKRAIPVDLIVHTKPMHEKFIQLGSMFSREILKTGEILYEKGN